MALIAGDRLCEVNGLSRVYGKDRKVKKADANLVQNITGFSIGGVSPIAHLKKIPIFIDNSLLRFDLVYSAAGHPNCVFASTVPELSRISGGKIKVGISKR